GRLFEELASLGEVALGAQGEGQVGLGAEERRVVVGEGTPAETQDLLLKLAGGREVLLVEQDQGQASLSGKRVRVFGAEDFLPRTNGFFGQRASVREVPLQAQNSGELVLGGNGDGVLLSQPLAWREHRFHELAGGGQVSLGTLSRG